MMKRGIAIAILCLIVVFVFAIDSFAQGRESFIKSLLNWFFEKQKVDSQKRKAPVDPTMPVEEEEERPEKDVLSKEPESSSAEERGDLEDMNVQKLFQYLTDLLTYNTDVLTFIPELKAEKDDAGKIFYTYTPKGGVTMRLDQLEKEVLINLIRRVIREVNRLNTERILKQLEQVRNAQRIPTVPPQAVTSPKVPSLPPQPPKVYTPPAPATGAAHTQSPPTPPNVPVPPPTSQKR